MAENNVMKVKKCVECGTEHKINYIYTHYKSKKHIKNKNKNNVSNLVNDTSLDGQYKHLLSNIDNIIDVCNHLKAYIGDKNNKIISNN
jgi:hypothetical protein